MKKQFNVIGLCTLLALPMVPATVIAAPQPDTRLDEVVVTAARSPQSVDETLAAVSVITRADIERGQYRSVAEALSGVPGLQFNRRGGLGKTTGISLRGTATNQTLVLIDGLRAGSATLGEASLQHLPLSQIERIEVVRGPHSTLYGSDAVGGVIQIFTRRGQDERAGSLSIGGGSRGTHETRATIAGPHGNSHYSLAVGHLGTRGIDAQANNVPLPGGWGATPDEPDRDGYRESSASLRLGHSFSPGNTVEIHGMQAFGNTEFDGTPDEADFRQQSAGINLQLRPAHFWDITLQGGQTRDDIKNYLANDFFSKFDTKRNQLGWQNDLLLGEHQLLTLGVDYLQDRISNSDAYDRDRRSTTGLYAQHRIDYDQHSLQLGFRHEDNQQFGSHNTYNVTYGLQLPRNLRLTAGYGTAFRAPTFNDLYSPWGGNPDLTPEESESYEIALQQHYGRGYWRLGIFRTNIDDMITWADTGGGIWLPSNVDRARINGLELESTHHLNQYWDIGLTLTLLDPKDRDSGKQLVRRSKKMASIDLDGDFGRWRAGMSLRANGHSYETRDNDHRLPGYAVIDLRAEYDLSDSLLLQGRIENLLDKDYEEVATYNMPGFGAFATLTYSF